MDAEIEVSFRRESGRLISALVRAFGPGQIGLAEDVAQETFLRALRLWPVKGMPPNPAAWLHRVARNLALDRLRREGIYRPQELAERLPAPCETPSEPGFGDDELRMLFLCCHPSLAPEAAIALTLHTLGGLSTGEIARGLLATEDASAQRLVRAKRRLRETQATFDLPGLEDLATRRDRVLKVLYLMFNEGYMASTGTALVREGLCDEAIDLAIRLSETSVGKEPTVHALLALMLFHRSRLASRVDGEGGLLLLEDQDRSKWDVACIRLGLAHFNRSAGGARMTPYHCEAAIAACHALAPSFEATDWPAVLAAYDDLIIILPSPVATLNRAIAISMTAGPQAALDELGALKADRRMDRYMLLAATEARLLERLGRLSEALCAYQRALAMASNEAERRFLTGRMKQMKSPSDLTGGTEKEAVP